MIAAGDYLRVWTILVTDGFSRTSRRTTTTTSGVQRNQEAVRA